MIDKREAEKLKKQKLKILLKKTSIRAYSKMNANYSVRRARSIKDVDPNYLTSKLSLNDIRDQKNLQIYKRFKQG